MLALGSPQPFWMCPPATKSRPSARNEWPTQKML